MYVTGGQGGAAVLGDWTGYVHGEQARLLGGALRPLAYLALAGLLGVLLLVATATVPVLFGYHTYVVNGGSMEPSLEAGSVAVTHPTSPRALQIGDIVAYRSSPGGPPVLHRIVEIRYEDGEPRFITQGDQNRTPDAEPATLAGPGDRVVYSVPYAGYILSFAQSTPGQLLLIGVPLVLLAALFLRGAGKEAVRTAADAQAAPIAATAPPIFAAGPPVAAPAPVPFTPSRAGALAAAAPMRNESIATPTTVTTPTAPTDAVSELPAFLLRQVRRRLPSPMPAPAPPTFKLLPEEGPFGTGPPSAREAA